MTGLALRLDSGRLWMIDCGEGTQHRMLRTDLRPARLDRVLITHLHGDHCYGLPGLLASAAVHGREREPVEIIGPRGIQELVETVTRVSRSELPFPLHFVEVEGADDLGERDGIRLAVRPLEHRIESFGYSLRERELPGRFHPERAVAGGVTPGPDFGRLQRGEAVELADGRKVLPEEVVDGPRPGRHLVVLGDTVNSPAMVEEARGCDVLVHEVTYDRTREKAAHQWGHSTSAMAGRFARQVGARCMIITHFSPRYNPSREGTLTVQSLCSEAQQESPETRVLAARDLWHFRVPFPDGQCEEGGGTDSSSGS